jgi:signal transduction histidine kinase
VAVLFVGNKHSKSADGYLPGVFSKTDEELVQAISDVTSKAFVQSLIAQATKEINELTSTDFEATPQTRSKLVGVLRRHIPGVLACCIAVYDSRDTVSPENRTPIEILEYGAVDQKTALQLNLHVKTTVAVTVNCVMRYDLPPVSGTSYAALYLLCRRPILARHEQDAIRFLTLNLAQHVHSELKLRDEIESLIQIRHAIRSGLQGVQHLDNAWEVYEQIAKNGLQPADFRVAMLRKSLQWARLFAERTRTLLEESRFLLSFITREKLKLNKSSIITVVTEAIACLKIDAEDRNIEINFQNDIRDPTLADVVMDRFLIDIAVFNILDNAVKYAFRDTCINVRLAATGAVWVLSVQDDGEYIRPEDYLAIFRPLVRRPNRHQSDTRGGTGLGLAVVKDIIEAHGGRDVEVVCVPFDTNRPDRGAKTTFTLCVPRHITKKSE